MVAAGAFLFKPTHEAALAGELRSMIRQSSSGVDLICVLDHGGVDVLDEL